MHKQFVLYKIELEKRSAPHRMSECWSCAEFMIPELNIKVMTNFSPFKMDAEYHPWMGLDMVSDVTDMVVYWCENRQWDKIQKRYL